MAEVEPGPAPLQGGEYGPRPSPPESPVIIGVPKEIKTREYRVGIVPAGVRALTARGHKVLVEKSAAAIHPISVVSFTALTRPLGAKRA